MTPDLRAVLEEARDRAMSPEYRESHEDKAQRLAFIAKIDAQLAAIRSLDAGQWIMVPREPTAEMINAMCRSYLVGPSRGRNAADYAIADWCAAIGAAPQPGE